MNTSILKKSVGILILAIYAGSQSFAAPKESTHDDHSEHEGHDHGKKDHDEHEHGEHDGHDHSMFEELSLPELLHLVEQTVEQIEARANGTKDDHLTEALETLIDATKHLPEKSGMLGEKKLLRVKSTAGSMEKVAHKLEAAISQEDTASIAKSAEQLHKLFGILKQQYPASISEGDHKKNDHGHKGHDH